SWRSGRTWTSSLRRSPRPLTSTSPKSVTAAPCISWRQSGTGRAGLPPAAHEAAVDQQQAEEDRRHPEEMARQDGFPEQREPENDCRNRGDEGHRGEVGGADPGQESVHHEKGERSGKQPDTEGRPPGF